MINDHRIYKMAGVLGKWIAFFLRNQASIYVTFSFLTLFVICYMALRLYTTRMFSLAGSVLLSSGVSIWLLFKHKAKAADQSQAQRVE